MNSLANEFLLDPEIIYLNHGSFGATPRSVFEYYQDLQRELERQPVTFLSREFQARMTFAREALAKYLCTESKDIVFVTNATTAINIVARSLPLSPGDEVLTSDHEYGAMDRTWQFLASRQGYHYIRTPIPVPILSKNHILDHIWTGITNNTRVIFLSHITSPTSIIFPIREICAEAKRRGILTVIDGAHAPGQIALNLEEIGADFYAGNNHKWLCAPKGSGFLYAPPERQALLSPLVVSWGWQSEKPGPSTLVDHHEWQGTRDPTAFLATPKAIQFQQEHHWENVRSACHELACYAQSHLTELTGIPPITTPEFFVQMVSAFLPSVDPEPLQKRLLDKFHIEVPVFKWNGIPTLRLSVQGYNSRRDIDQLLFAIKQMYHL
ncbi:MAG: aminotransferase class V [Chloroflexi bacterium RBG_16_48_8]|nr:MAG: aminotransferase class V [Chloroflexi bacterium RBG_16_48_8]